MKILLQPVGARLRAVRLSKRGQTLVEYALILAVLSITSVAVFGLLDSRIANIFSRIDLIIDTAQGSH